MEQNAKAKIRHIGKILSFFCQLSYIIFTCLAIISILAAGLSFVSPDIIEKYRAFFRQNTFFLLLENTADLHSMEPQYVNAISCAMGSITFLVLALFSKRMLKILCALVDNERPFTKETASTIRRASIPVILMVFYNPIAGVLISLILLLLSYLVDYGAILQEKTDETNRIQEEMIVSFAEITENKSGQTGQHIRRVSEYTKIIALAMGMSEEQAETLRLASTMHDIGKLLIPSEILEKPGKLTNEEYAVIKQHTTYGGQLLDHVEGDIIETARTVAMEHHERPDGHGYPKGLSDDITLEGRIVAVADVYDALTSRRSYKEAWEEDRALQEIRNGSGTQFDPEVVRAFESAYDQISEVRERYRDN